MLKGCFTHYIYELAKLEKVRCKCHFTDNMWCLVSLFYFKKLIISYVRFCIASITFLGEQWSIYFNKYQIWCEILSLCGSLWVDNCHYVSDLLWDWKYSLAIIRVYINLIPSAWDVNLLVYCEWFWLLVTGKGPRRVWWWSGFCYQKIKWSPVECCGEFIRSYPENRQSVFG